MNVASIVLAAGGASRLGEPKQLVQIDGKSLVALAAKRCIDAGCSTVVVVVGNAAAKVCDSIAHISLMTVYNSTWRSGQASSIVAGINALIEQAAEHRIATPDAVLIMLCDTPRITAGDLVPLIVDIDGRGNCIAATSYPEGGGVPACFPWSLHQDLLRLSGDQGAKELIRSGQYPIRLHSLPNANTDIDSRQDLEKVRSFN